MVSRQIGRQSILLCTVAVAALTLLASNASALVITGGPTYTLPGGGSCTVANIPSRLTGATVTCTGVNLAAHSNVYFGIRNDTNVNGLATDGAGPSGAEVFAFSSAGVSSITYTGSTTITSANPASGFGTDTVSSTLSLALSSGSATVVSTGGTPASNGNGQIERLFRLTSGSSFTFEVDITASDPHFSGQACTGLYDPTGVAAPGGTCVGRVDLAFYYSDCGDGVTDSPEQCDLGGSNGTLGSCCSATCTYVAASTVCRGAAGICDVQETCTGSSAFCPGDSFQPNSTVCRASGGVCDLQETCTGSGASCPADAKSGAVCRASAGACDLADSCDGINDDCPADAKITSTCRGAAGVCDVAEV